MRIALIWTLAGAGALGLVACSTTEGKLAPPTPDALTPTQVEALTAEALDEIWRSTGLPEAERPRVERERFVQPNERGAVVAKCMRDDGFDAVEDGMGIRIDHTDDQRTPAALSRYVCEARFPVVATFNAPLNESQLRYLYRYLTTELRPCLAEHGVHISDPPSLEVFIEDHPKNGGWAPFEEVPPSRFIELEAACPQRPPELWG